MCIVANFVDMYAWRWFALDSDALPRRMTRRRRCGYHSVLVVMGWGRIWIGVVLACIHIVLGARRLRGEAVGLFMSSWRQKFAHGSARASCSIRTRVANVGQSGAKVAVALGCVSLAALDGERQSCNA